MTSDNTDLQNFLQVVAKISTTAADAPGDLDDLRRPLDSSGLLDLARDLGGEPEGLHWLASTVQVAAESIPSLAYALAARYAAHRSLGPDSDVSEATFGLVDGTSRVVISRGLEPDTIVVLNAPTNALRAVPWESFEGAIRDEQRTGLKRARLVTVDLSNHNGLERSAAPRALAEWDILTGAVLVGMGRRATRVAERYAQERHQFGVPISSFAGLRAVIAEMELRMDSAEALLRQGLDAEGTTESVSAAAGKAAMDTCIDAIQCLGGYGYIDEYPVSGLLRDVVSVQARSGGRRHHVARIASRVLGPREAANREEQ